MDTRKMKWNTPELVSLTASDKAFGDCGEGSSPQSGNCSPTGNSAGGGDCRTGNIAFKCGNGGDAIESPPG